jgi:translation elongation factor EF-1beta
MHDLEDAVRAIEADGLVWGTSSLIPIGYGVEKLRINLIVEDEKVSVTDLQEQIEGQRCRGYAEALSMHTSNRGWSMCLTMVEA